LAQSKTDELTHSVLMASTVLITGASQGSIINVGSFGGKMPLPEMTAYCASKYAVTGLTESLRLKLEPKGIFVSVVHPGIIKSSFGEIVGVRASCSLLIPNLNA